MRFHTDVSQHPTKHDPIDPALAQLQHEVVSLRTSVQCLGRLGAQDFCTSRRPDTALPPDLAQAPGVLRRTAELREELVALVFPHFDLSKLVCFFD